MPAVPPRSRVSGLFERLAGMDRFGLFLSGFIVVYAATSLLIEHLLGVIGFAKTPYLNGAAYLYTLVFIGLGIVLDKVSLRFFLPHPFGLAVMAVLGISCTIGIANDNAVQYIVAWGFYILAGVLVFQFFRNPARPANGATGAVETLFSLPFMGLMLALAFLSIFNKENHYQYMLFEVIALFAILVRPRLIEKGLGLALYLLLHLGSNEGFVQVEINRASILAVGTIGLLTLIYRRYLVVMLFVIVAVVGGLLYAVSLDDDTVDTLPRNIKEAIYLMKGDDIYNHISSYQRVFEGQKVMEDFSTASDAEWLFGKGLGRTVDMTGAADRTPGQHALLGALQVHNIHFLHYAVLHKFGLAGLSILIGLAGGMLWMFAVDLGRGRMDAPRLFFYFYLFYVLVFAFPASNFLVANPLWPAFLGMLCWLRAVEIRPQAVNLITPVALT
jgi:MFS family permease